jgi:uncharacterized protein YggE
MKKYSIVSLLIIFLALHGSAQVVLPEEKPNIEVTGSGELEVVPDEIFIRIVLKEKNKNNEKYKIEAQESKLLQKLKENGFDIANLSLSGAGGELQYRVFRKDQVLTEKTLLMKTKNAGEVNKLFQILDDLAIEDAAIVKTSHSAIENLRKEVKIQAMKAAKDKADYLLTAIGEQTGKPLVIREQDHTVYPAKMYSNVAMREDAGAMSEGGLGDEIAFTKIKIRYEIYAKFAIK